MKLILAAGIGYLLGSTPTSLLVGRLSRGIDIRNHGSRNPGASNALRVLGWRPALVVLAVDVAKGWLAVVLGVRVAEEMNGPVGVSVALVAGICALAGHLWPLWASFRGGKGVATAAGVILAFDPWLFLVCVGIFVALLAGTRWISVASIGAAVLSPLVAWGLQASGATSGASPVLTFTALLAVVLPWTHRDNIRRLRSGTESRLGAPPS